MEDDQTGSLWSQVSGECIQGELMGKKLKQYPSDFSTYGEATKIPGILFLTKPEKGEGQSPYKKYFEDRGKVGIFGTVFYDSLLEAKDKVYGLRRGETQLAVPAAIFENAPVYLIKLEDVTLLVLSDGESRVACKIVPPSFGSDIRLKVTPGRFWLENGSDEKARITFEGPTQVEGQPLSSYPVVTAFWFAWKSFFPNSEIYQP